MPSVIRRRLLHIICDDTDYEQSLFQNIDSTSIVQTIATKLKGGLNNDDGFTTSFDITTYESYRLHLIGNFQPWEHNVTKPTTYPTIKQPFHENDC